MPVHLERTSVALAVREPALTARAAAEQKGLHFALELPDDLPQVWTDPVKLGQVLGNLLSNAVKFTPDGIVTLRATRDGARVRLDVIDTGIGIPAEELETIWEDFRQLDQSRTREYGGTGLGLSIVRKLAERLGAEVSVTSEPDVGSTFTVLVPADDAPADGAGERAKPLPAGPGAR
jgi:signal transduction histidine kinase